MKSFLFILLFGMCCPPTEVPAQIAIVTHKSVKSSVLKKQELVDIFSLEASRWPGGNRIVPIELKGKSDVKSRFYAYLGRSTKEMKRDRLRIVLAGDGDPPVPAKSAEEMREKISTTPGAIGYLPLDLVSKEEVNVVLVIDN